MTRRAAWTATPNRAALSPNVAIDSRSCGRTTRPAPCPGRRARRGGQGVGALFPHRRGAWRSARIPDRPQGDRDRHAVAVRPQAARAEGHRALYVKRGVRFRSLIQGRPAGAQPARWHENTPGIVGLGKAAELAGTHMHDEITRVAALRDRLEKGLLQRNPGDHLHHGDVDNRLPNTCNIACEYIEGEAICCCSTAPASPPRGLGLHVRIARAEPCSARDERALHGGARATRFSFSRDNTDEDASPMIEAMPPIIASSGPCHRSGRATAPRRPSSSPSTRECPSRSDEPCPLPNRPPPIRAVPIRRWICRSSRSTTRRCETASRRPRRVPAGRESVARAWRSTAAVSPRSKPHAGDGWRRGGRDPRDRRARG